MTRIAVRDAEERGGLAARVDGLQPGRRKGDAYGRPEGAGGVVRHGDHVTEELARGDEGLDGARTKIEPIEQDKSQQIRYTRNSDFTDAVAAQYLARAIGSADVQSMMAKRDDVSFCRVRICE